MKRTCSAVPRLAVWILRFLFSQDYYLERSGDLEEVYADQVEESGFLRARVWLWFQILKLLNGVIRINIVWRFIMLKYYLKIAFRNLRKNKGYAFINVAGLAVGIACFAVIFIYVSHELSYDTHHADNDRVFRVVEDTGDSVFAPVAWPLAPALMENYPQVEYSVRTLPFYRAGLVKREELMFYENLVMYAENDLFNVLTIPFLQGDPQAALQRPNSLVLSQRMAEKYFPDENPIKQTIRINTRNYEITGIVKNPPTNTHLKYDFIASLKTIEDQDMMSNWYGTECYTYIKLKPHVDRAAFEEQMSAIAHKYVGEQLKTWDETISFVLQPIAGIHLHSHLKFEIEPPGNTTTITFFSAIAVLILLIACINFMNLTTARSANRAKEVGLRKTVGSKRSQLIIQFMGESTFIVFISILISLFISCLSLPFFNSLTGAAMSVRDLWQPASLLRLLGIIVIVGIGAGSYPALFLSSFSPASTLRGPLKSGTRGTALRKILVVGQFAMSITLIIGTLMVHKQLNFMKNQPLGFDKEQKYIIQVRGGASIRENSEEVKDQFLQHPSITGTATSSTVPGRGVSSFAVKLPELENKSQSMYHMYFDPNFIQEYDIKILAGRSFQKEMRTDIEGAFLINEAAVRALGWDSPEKALGQRLYTGRGGHVYPIIGVTSDFHYRGLQTKVEPLVMGWLPSVFSNVTLSLNTDNLQATLKFIKSKWQELFPGYPLEGFFLDTDFERQYRSDEQAGKIFGTFAILGIFIACLGLLGLASFTAEQRTKEIGIRKVLGASVSGIIVLLTREFMKWVAIATIIAWPVSYYIMREWLANFAYRTSLDWIPFFLAAFIAFIIALITVSAQAVRAAQADPATSLKYE